MLPVVYYIAKVIICSVILYGYYWLMLRNKNFHAYNRFYLLAATGLSLLLPMVRIHLWSSNESEQGTVIQMLRAVSTGDEYMQEVVIRSNAPLWTPEQLYPFVYLAVSLVLLIILIHGLFRIAFLLKKFPVQQIGDIAFINSDAKGTPFSFFKYIFWNEKIDMDTVSGRQIFQHEMAHIREKHSFDKLFLNIVLIFFWINPVFWLIRKELNMIHEFIADRKAIDNNDTAAFAAMILQATYPQHRFQLSSSFFYSPIKRRLLMLTRNNSKAGYIGRLMVLPLAVLLFAAFTFRNKQAIAQIIAPQEISVDNDKEVHNIQAVAVTDTVPKRLPADAEWDRAAGKKPALTTADGNTVLVLDQRKIDNNKVLYVVDGKRIGSGGVAEPKLNELVSPEKVIEVRILKGDEAFKKYGDDGKYGVIEINTKAEIKEIQLNPPTLDEVIVIGDPSKVKTTTAIVEERPVKIASTNSNKLEEVTVTGYSARIRKVEGEPFVVTSDVKREVEEVNATRLRATRPADGQPVFAKVEVEPQFPGGVDAWKKFLQQNVKASISVNEGWKTGSYTVIVQFIVYSDGRIGDVLTVNYRGTETAQHCIDIIKNGPKWVPAVQNGIKVNAYRKQPITFVIGEQK